MSNMISTFMELTPFSRQRKSENRDMYRIQIMIHAMREECGALWLRSRQPVLNWVIMKEGCLGAQPQQTLHNAWHLRCHQAEWSQRALPGGGTEIKGNRTGNSLARTSPCGKYRAGAAWRTGVRWGSGRLQEEILSEFYGVLQAERTWFNIWGWPKGSSVFK